LRVISSGLAGSGANYHQSVSWLTQMVRDGIKKGGGYDFENAQCAGNANEEYDAEWSFVDNVY
jgi:hypothetical protein